MRRLPDRETESARGVDGEVVLSDVDVVRAAENGEVGTVVDDERYAEAPRDLSRLLERAQERTVREVFSRIWTTSTPPLTAAARNSARSGRSAVTRYSRRSRSARPTPRRRGGRSRASRRPRARPPRSALGRPAPRCAPRAHNAPRSRGAREARRRSRPADRSRRRPLTVITPSRRPGSTATPRAAPP